MRSVFCSVLAVVATAAAAGPAEAGMITYTFAGTATGTAGGTPFTDAAFTITVTADTADVFGPFGAGQFVVPGQAATIDIAGVGAGVLTRPRLVGLGQVGQSVFLGDEGDDQVDLAVVNPALATYDLKSGFGPVTDPRPSEFFTGDSPELGVVTFASVGPVTFTAALAPAAVPEPASLALAGAGLVGLVGFARRKARRTA